MNILTFANYKGGSGKTTSVAFLGHAFCELGYSVALVDADPQGSLLQWSEGGNWDIPVISLPTKTIHKKLAGILGNSYDLVLIDTPGFDDRSKNDGAVTSSGIVYSAIRAADMVIMPMAPTMMELHRVAPVHEAIQEVADSMGQDIPTHVMFNRAVNNASSTKVLRSSIEDMGLSVMQQVILRKESLAQAFNAPIGTQLYGHFSAAKELEELLK